MKPPNGLAFSRRERIQEHRQKPNDLAREAVGWNGVLGGLAHAARVPQRHDHTTPARNHASTTGLVLNHAQHTITRRTTDNPHDGRSNHAGTTSPSTTSLAQRARTSETSAWHQNGSANHAAQPPNG
nr:Unknown Function [uncultured bacterium]